MCYILAVLYTETQVIVDFQGAFSTRTHFSACIHGHMYVYIVHITRCCTGLLVPDIARQARENSREKHNRDTVKKRGGKTEMAHDTHTHITKYVVLSIGMGPMPAIIDLWGYDVQNCSCSSSPSGSTPITQKVSNIFCGCVGIRNHKGLVIVTCL